MDSNGTPGKIETVIYGLLPGAEYNSPPLDFKISGFKGTPKYSKFYARSDGPITGGLEGKYNVLSDEDKAKAQEELASALKEKLFKKALSQIPPGFILFKDAVFLKLDRKSTRLN